MRLKKLSEYVVVLSAEEVELLYDALDARNDRFEDWLRGIGCDQPPTDEEKERFEEELAKNTKLNDDFQPLITAIRDNGHPDAGIERIADKERVR